jgi:hypothetical protein
MMNSRRCAGRPIVPALPRCHWRNSSGRPCWRKCGRLPVRMSSAGASCRRISRVSTELRRDKSPRQVAETRSCPVSNIEHSTFNIQLPTFNFQHSTSNIQLPTFNFQHSTSNIQLPTFNFQHSTFNIQHSTFNIQHSTFNIQHSTFNIQHSTSNGRGKGPRIMTFFRILKIKLSRFRRGFRLHLVMARRADAPRS